ncbi:molecular chaperone HtpG [Salinisphaera hydrothermalis]|uniref:Chaperone protein HtpG n=1 Tax=Salinisphaera hydrothermalis (strain C41B8) TaxID=1304275 RepID=A0A084IIF9_SALHC|nr:molecular chaperone HtpG [Salinisphaera hydrothermalis]KEZ76493.1 heat shock protein 90 [Salinisphaera hydrothermalis C41B8]
MSDENTNTQGAAQAGTNAEKHGFQAEVKQLLQLMIHSMYSNKEVFARELISNASDALDTLRFEGLKDDSLFEGDSDLQIWIEQDKGNRTVSISDNGIGMTRDQVMERIGTIAKSGTRAFLDSLSGDEKKDAKLIGQFGVGFYSAFIVADQVVVDTRRGGESTGVRWISDGGGEYTLEEIDKPRRGTTVTLHLREDEDEFLEPYRMRHLVKTYSDHIAFPIKMREQLSEEDEKEGKEAGWEQVNRGAPLWAEPKSSLSDEDYVEFYKHTSHDFEDPLTWTHNKVEGSQEYTNLLFIPKRAPFDLFDPNGKAHGVKLYVQRVFIMDDADKLMPRYLRFVKGVIDSNDLPLNVSREILQNNRLLDKIRAGSVKKVLGLIESMANDEDDPEKFKTFSNEFGTVLKEGIVEDYENQARIAKLLRFKTTTDETADPGVSLDEYIARMQPGQEKIYYITADTLAEAKHSPHLEIFKKKNIEVLLLTDRVDEWVMAHMTEYEGKEFSSVAKGALDLGDAESEEEKEQQKKLEEESKDLVERIKEALGERVNEVRVTHRLTDSPACLVADEHGMSAHLERILKEAGQAMPNSAPHLEINPTHPLVEKLASEQGEDEFNSFSQMLFEQAVLAEGGELEDPASFVRRMNQMLLAVSRGAA